MSKSVIKAYLFLAGLSLSFMVSAAGLGKLTLNSYLGQPIKAKIDLVSVKKEDVSSIKVSLASLQTFRLANIDYARFLRTFEFSVENSVDGQPYVKLISLQPVTEPSFSMLIELNWSSGSLIREYTVQLAEDIHRLASPVVQQDEPVIPISVRPEPTTPVSKQQDHSRNAENLVGDQEPTVKETKPEPEPDPEVFPAQEQEQEQEQERVLAEKSVATTYGPVKSGDTLTKIIQERIFYQVQLNQILVALLRANREAFIDNNMNRLKTGYILRIPDESEIATIFPDAADKEVKVQMANWEAYRQRLVVEASISSASGESEQTTAEGKITTILDDDMTETAHESTEGMLKLSKGMEVVGDPEEGSGEDTMSSIQEKVNIIEDNSIADEKALNEANARISLLEQAMIENRIANEKELAHNNQRIIELEKNIKELQHLLKLKNSTMASAEAQAESNLSQASESPPVIEKTVKVVQRPVDSVEEKGSNPTAGSNPTIINWVLWIMILLLIIGLWWKIKQSTRQENKNI